MTCAIRTITIQLSKIAVSRFVHFFVGFLLVILPTGFACAEATIRASPDSLSLANQAIGTIRSGVDQQVDEALSKKSCPMFFANSQATFEALGRYDSSTWRAVADDCRTKGRELNFANDVAKLKTEKGFGVGQATCRGDGTIRIVHNGNGMATAIKFANENSLESIVTTPAGDQEKNYAVRYYKAKNGEWRISSSLQTKSGSPEKNDEPWNSYLSRYACSLRRCSQTELLTSVRSPDELTSARAPFGLLSSEYSVKAAASLNLTRRLLLGGKSGEASYKEYCALLKDNGAVVPSEIAFSPSENGESSGGGIYKRSAANRTHQ